MSLLKDLKLFARLYRDRHDFVFRPRWAGGRQHCQVNIRARDGRFEANVRLRRGTSDLGTFRQIFVKRDYDLSRLARGAEIGRLYASIASRGVPLILDLGANIGLASLYFAKRWPEARIIAVEPSAENYRLMCDNIADHGNIQPVRAAVAANAGAVRIVNPEADAWGYRTEAAAPGAEGAIAAVPVADLLKMAPLSIPFIAKIDIEGFEDDLFSTNTDWVSAFPVMVIELHDWMLPRAASSRNFLRTIAQLDRDFVCQGENVFSISNGAA
jgi:FkbM family methyltransferase